MKGGMNIDDDKDNRRVFEEIAYHLFMGELQDKRKVIKELAKLKTQGRYNNPLFDKKKEFEAIDEQELTLIDEAMTKGIFLKPHPKITIENKDEEDDKDD